MLHAAERIRKLSAEARRQMNPAGGTPDDSALCWERCSISDLGMRAKTCPVRDDEVIKFVNDMCMGDDAAGRSSEVD